MDYIFYLPVWLGCGAFTLWAMVRTAVLEFGQVSRGDLAFFLLMAAMGPLGLGAAFAAIIMVSEGFWGKRVWPSKQEWKSQLLRDSGSHSKSRDA